MVYILKVFLETIGQSCNKNSSTACDDGVSHESNGWEGVKAFMPGWESSCGCTGRFWTLHCYMLPVAYVACSICHYMANPFTAYRWHSNHCWNFDIWRLLLSLQKSHIFMVYQLVNCVHLFISWSTAFISSSAGQPQYLGLPRCVLGTQGICCGSSQAAGHHTWLCEAGRFY